MMSKRSVILFLLAFGLLAGCSKSQTAGSDDSPIGWNHSLDAVPAGAIAVMSYDFGDFEARIFRGEQPPEDLNLLQGLFVKLVGSILAENDISSVEQFGIDPEGDVTLYLEDYSAHLIVRTTDATALIAEFLREAPNHLEQEEIEVDGQPFHVIHEDKADIFTGDFGEFASFSLVLGDVSDKRAALARMMDGSKTIGRFIDSPAAQEALATTDPADQRVGLIWSDLPGLNAFAERLAADTMSETIDEEDRALLGVDAETEPTSSSRDAACAAAATDITSRYRWFGLSMFRGAGEGHTVARLGMSAAEIERTRKALVGAPSLELPAFEDAVISFALGLDLRQLIDGLPRQPELAMCDNYAAIRGILSQVGDNLRRGSLRRDLAFVAGSMSFSLFDIDMQGMVPLPDAAVAIRSEQPERLAAQLQSLLIRDGDVSVETVPDTQYPTTRFSSPSAPISVQMIQAPDRIVMTLGNVPQAALHALIDPTLSDDVLRIHANGDRMSTLMADFEQYIEDMGGVDSYAGTMMTGVLTLVDGLRTLDVDFGFEGNTLELKIRR